MTCAWELKPQVLVAVLTRELVATAWAKSLRELSLPPNSQISYITGMPFDHARNTACESALKFGFQYLFFLDDDILLPPNSIHMLMSHNLDITSGLYYRRALPIHPVALVDGNPPTPIEVAPNSLIKADFVGAGCLLIRRNVLEKMANPWFEWMLDKPGDFRKLSEDFEFARKAKLAGFQPHVDTRVLCTHVGLGSSSHEGYRPLSI